MERTDEKLELAKLVTMTEVLLRRICFQQVFSEAKQGCCPALTPQQSQLVMVVHERGSMTVRQLTQVLYVNPPAVSTMVERLVELGVLTREENPKDRREVLVQVSPYHAVKIEEIEQQYLKTALDIFEKIGIKHARKWGDVCRRIQEVCAGEQKPKELV